MVLVVGSTGRLGSEICHTLAMHGIPIRALIRLNSDRQKVDRLRKYGAQFAWGDLRDRRSLAEACQGVYGIICSASAFSAYDPGTNDFQTVDLNGVISLVDAADEAGLPRFVFISFALRPEFDSPLMRAKHAVENYLITHRMEYTILHPGFMLETWFSPEMGFDPSTGMATLFGEGKAPIAWVSHRDVAKAAVNALTDPAADRAVIELRGPDRLSQCQVIRLFEDKIDSPLNKIGWSVNALAARRLGARDPFEQSRLSLFLACASGDQALLVPENSYHVTGTRTVEAYVEARTLALSPLAWTVEAEPRF